MNHVHLALSFLSDSVCNNQWYTSIMKLIFHNLQVQTTNFPSSAFKDSPILNSPDNFHLPQFCLCPPEENNFDLGITWICSGALSGGEDLFWDTVVATLPQSRVCSPGQPILAGYKNFQIFQAQAEEIAKWHFRNPEKTYIVNKQFFTSSLINPFSW